MKKFKQFLLIALCIFVTPGTLSAQSLTPNWKRGIYVFDNALFDFGYGKFRAGVYNSSLEDCSNEEFYCAISTYASVVVPRICEPMAIGTRWNFNGVTTKVVDQVGQAQGHLTVPGSQWYVLVTDTTPDTAFLYSGSGGVTALLFDPQQTIGFEKLARQGDLGGFVDRAVRGEIPERASFLPLVTADNFAGCMPPK